VVAACTLLWSHFESGCWFLRTNLEVSPILLFQEAPCSIRFTLVAMELQNTLLEGHNGTSLMSAGDSCTRKTRQIQRLLVVLLLLSLSMVVPLPLTLLPLWLVLRLPARLRLQQPLFLYVVLGTPRALVTLRNPRKLPHLMPITAPAAYQVPHQLGEEAVALQGPCREMRQSSTPTAAQCVPKPVEVPVHGQSKPGTPSYVGNAMEITSRPKVPKELGECLATSLLPSRCRHQVPT